MSKQKEHKNNRFRNANYSVIITSLVLVVIVVVNLLVSSLSSDFTKFDTSDSNVYAIGDVTTGILDELNKDITIYTLAEPGQEEAQLQTMLEVYSAYSDHIKLQTINPAENPEFINDYQANLNQGSIVVSCGDKHKSVDVSDMFISIDDTSTGETKYRVDMEGQITSAISYVIADKIPHAYVLSGNNKEYLTTEVGNSIIKQNIEVANLNLTEDSKIPEDADILILNQPTEDITDTEYNLVSDFLDNGGSIYFVESAKPGADVDFTNINKILDRYGVSFDMGTVLEADSDQLIDESKPYYYMPTLVSNDITDSLIDGEKNVLLYMPDNINVGESPEGVKVKTIVETSKNAYFKEKTGSYSMTKMPTDPTGVFNLGVAITDDISTDIQSRAVIFSSSSIVDEEADTTIGGGNISLTVNSLQWLANQDTDVFIATKQLSLTSLVISAAQAKRNLTYLVIIMPIIVLGFGFYVWFRRRRR